MYILSVINKYIKKTKSIEFKFIIFIVHFIFAYIYCHICQVSEIKQYIKLLDIQGNLELSWISLVFVFLYAISFVYFSKKNIE